MCKTNIYFNFIKTFICFFRNHINERKWQKGEPAVEGVEVGRKSVGAAHAIPNYVPCIISLEVGDQDLLDTPPETPDQFGNWGLTFKDSKLRLFFSAIALYHLFRPQVCCTSCSSCRNAAKSRSSFLAVGSTARHRIVFPQWSWKCF